MSPERVKEIYDRLVQLVINLDPNPAGRGPLYLQDLISQTRGFLNETAYFIQQVMQERHRLEMNLAAEESAFDVRSDELLASDARVTRLPNIDDRKAMINSILGEDRRRIQSLKTEVKNLGFVDKAIRHRHKELENTMSAIRLQRSLVETEIRTGAYLGDETNSSRGHRGAQPPIHEYDDEEIQALVDAAEKVRKGEDPDTIEAPPPAPEEPPAEPQPVVVAAVEEPKAEAEVPDEVAISRFLDGDDDYDALFNSL